MKKLIEPIQDFFGFGRSFLAKSQLRSLQNLTILPPSAVEEVVDSLELIPLERSFILQWNDFCNGIYSNLHGYWMFFLDGYYQGSDEYFACYTPTLELTKLGQRIKDDAYRAQSEV